MNDMREVILHQGDQIQKSLAVNSSIKIDGSFDAIILAGMGGSGHPGDLLNALQLTTIPLYVHRDYGLPKIHAKNPLILISTYSGNTEESLSAYTAAKEAGYQIMCNTSGGKLSQWSQRDNVPLIKIDFPGMQPRHTLFASFTGIYIALKNSGLAVDITKDLQRVADNLNNSIAGLEAEAKALAAQLKGVTPIFVSDGELGFAAKNFKIQTNENVKTPAFWNVFPELNHNEMIGFSHPQTKFHTVILCQDETNARVKARISVTKELYEQWGVTVSEHHMPGTTQLERIFFAVSFGLWTTYYLALAYDIDPVPVAGVENFKKKLVELVGELG